MLGNIATIVLHTVEFQARFNASGAGRGEQRFADGGRMSGLVA